MLLNRASLEQLMIFLKGQMYSFFSTVSWYHCHTARDNRTQRQIQFLSKEASWNQHCRESLWESWNLVWIFGHKAEIVFTCPDWAQFQWFVLQNQWSEGGRQTVLTPWPFKQAWFNLALFNSSNRKDSWQDQRDNFDQIKDPREPAPRARAVPALWFPDETHSDPEHPISSQPAVLKDKSPGFRWAQPHCLLLRGNRVRGTRDRSGKVDREVKIHNIFVAFISEEPL